MVDQSSETDLSVEDENEEESVEINYDIASYPSDFTLSGIARMWQDRDITTPDYQREFVWTQDQSSLLIDSFLRGLPVPPVFFYVDEDNKNLVIDGQQRILRGCLGTHFRNSLKIGRLDKINPLFYTLLIPIFRFFIQPMSSKLFVSKERNSRWYLLGFRKNSSQAALNSANVS